MTSRSKLGRALHMIAPGLMVAATGVGAGDLATGAIAGSRLGLAVLWAVPLGALCKWLLSEALTRYQLVTGETVLEGSLGRIPKTLRWTFLLYLLPWSYCVGAALVSACGVALHALVPVLDPEIGKVSFGIAASVTGLIIARSGGFDRFERVMGICIAMMFVTTLTTAIALQPDLTAILRGSVWPKIPDPEGEGPSLTLGLVGGVGGTLTVICYGYWLRETGRTSVAALRTCRIDLAVGYGATAAFGMAMVVIGSFIQADGKGASLLVALGDALDTALGPIARTAFLIGAVAAVFSSLLGVWQSVPYVFADFLRIARDEPRDRPLTQTRAYRWFGIALAVIPLAGLWSGFVGVQKLYAIVGACFLPVLAIALLALGRRQGPLGPSWRNPGWSWLGLVATLVLFAVYGLVTLTKQLR